MALSLFLCGDVMTGRGIDQALPFPLDPKLYEPYITNARDYLELAENVNGPIVTPFYFSYIWGDAIRYFETFPTDIRMINLETDITKSNDYWKTKDIHYRMNPLNLPCLIAGNIDCCSLANNHMLDWGYDGLLETVRSLDSASIAHCGAGCDIDAAIRPAIFHKNGRRVLVFAFGSVSSGVPLQWQAMKDRPGIAVFDEKFESELDKIKCVINKEKRPGDIIVLSIHWGENWGMEIDSSQINFAHSLIDSDTADIIWGHSSHHAKPFEVYHNKLILYGCGDFLNDYEGIRGYEEFRPDLAVMFFVYCSRDGGLTDLVLVPQQIKKFRLNRPESADIDYLHRLFNKKSSIFGSRLIRDGEVLRLE